MIHAHDQRHVYPPSTQIVCPRHIVQASLLRNTTMFAISHGSTKRPIGVLSSIGRDFAGSPHVLIPMSDQATVGAMLLTCDNNDDNDSSSSSSSSNR